jgi:anti-anti-sigma factor
MILEVRLERDSGAPDRARLVAVGELDMASAPVLRRHVRECMRAEPATTHLTLDLQAVRFIDSTGLRALVLTWQACADEKIDFSLVASDRVLRVLDVAGLLELLVPDGPPTI